jgi:ABC-type phosphate/phosphonate transport system substrate-binding protein
MKCIHRFLPAAIVGLVTVAAAVSPTPGGDGMLRIGIPKTFFHDMSEGLIREATEPFAESLRESTGLRGEAITGGDPLAVARQLKAGKFQLAVLHQFELAWAKQKDPDLEPLVVAVRTVQDYRVSVVVRKDASAKTFADLKGKDLAVPKRSTEACWLYLDQLCDRNGGTPKQVLSHVVHGKDVESALDDVVRGKYTAAVVDSHGLEFYEDLKPGVFARLRVLEQSDTFPPDVVVYEKGSLSDATLTRIRDGLSKVATTANGRDMMKLWRVTSFQPVPADFSQTLATCLKTFPTPPPKEKTSR